MAHPPGSTAGDGVGTLTRALCLLMLVLMAGAAVYGSVMALRYFRQIGV